MKKSQLIPVEVLRVEDKIFGPLNFLQIGLLALPLAAAVILLFFPPLGKLPLFKMAIIILVFAASGLLALRVHERLVLDWLILIGCYNCRPKVYLKPAPTQIQETPTPDESLPLLDIRQFVPAPINQKVLIPKRSMVLKDRFNQGTKGKNR